MEIAPAIAIRARVHHGAQYRKDHHMQKVCSGVMSELKPQQPGFAIDAEIKLKVFVKFVVQLGALANARNPVLEKLDIGIRT